MQTTVKNPTDGKEETKAATPSKAVNSAENHKLAAKHHTEAAKHNLDAAKHHEAGNHEKAHQSAVLATGHSLIASNHLNEDAKQHATSAK
jgi:hypothetical protein